MTTVSTTDPQQAGPGGFLPIAIFTLAPTETLDFDLYRRTGPRDPVVMYRERSYPLAAEDLERLISAGFETLYISVAANENYCRYLNDEVLNSTTVPSSQRFNVLVTVNRAVFESALRSGNTERMIQFARELGEQMSEIMCDEETVLTDLLSLMTHDYYTYTHVANVCTYTLVLAKSLGIDEQPILREIATGSLLHDVGKQQTPIDVLNHHGRLNAEQREHIQRHPTDGFRKLCHRPDMSLGQLMMVYQHHERLDGKGYPVGVAGTEIHEWARICKIADVFDALSNDRPYRKGDSVDQVLRFLEERTDTEFDKEMVECFVQCFRATSKRES